MACRGGLAASATAGTVRALMSERRGHIMADRDPTGTLTFSPLSHYHAPGISEYKRDVDAG
jgi:hypothetical protein